MTDDTARDPASAPASDTAPAPILPPDPYGPAIPAGAYPPPPAAPPPVNPDRVPFAKLVLSVGAASLLGLFVVATSATAGVIAVLVLSDSAPDWVRGVVYFTLITLSYSVQLAVVWILARRRRLRFAPAVGLNPFPLKQGILAAIVVSFVGRLLAGGAALFIQSLGIKLPEVDPDPTRVFGAGPVSTVLVLVLLMVVAPFAEEVVFRGAVMASLQTRYGPRWAIAGSGLLFALVHVQLTTVIAIVFVGLALGWVAMRYRSIWPSIIAHSLFNGVSAAAIFWLRGTGRL